ncbi:CDP-glycerol glycerophosphotransferase family protein [Alteribacter keqinensis]|uniref:Uncharacterized protein n=1 Tax=Alteribacter keqinensis TaxID=2483800 RepID=A0A3M7TMA9_9BACI|nr:CDP-glycerol glycerophosphotransferase family protein [Alteribacter keqinensis]RNA66763.1 hypothetical protein EBO34_16245 [Alteribacter keqinensis]
MADKSKILWSQSIDFLRAFSTVTYAGVPVSLPLFRDFQLFVSAHKKTAATGREKFTHQIHKACSPYLINGRSRSNFNLSGSILVRAELAPLIPKNNNISVVYLAHTKSEYNKAMKNPSCRPLYYLPKLPQTKLPLEEEQKAMNEIAIITNAENTPPFLRSPLFVTWMKKKAAKFMSNIKRLHSLFEYHPIKKTLYGSTINCHGALVTTFAQSRMIPTINYQHGLLGEEGHLPVNADVHLVWGNSHKQYLQSHGAPSHLIHVVQPSFQDNVRSKKTNIKKSSKKQVLIALQPLSHRFNKRMIKTIEAAAEKFSKHLHLTVKLHPAQSGHRLRKIITPKMTTLLPHGSVPLYDLIEQADLVVTSFSTVGYEALLLGKPVIYYSNNPSFFYFLKNNPVCGTKQVQYERLFKSLILTNDSLVKTNVRDDLKDYGQKAPGLEYYLR